MKHNFNERKQNRIDHATMMSQKKAKEGNSLYNTAHEMASFIPLGQPILVGHHSEHRDRRYRNKIHDKFGKAFKAMDTAKYYEEKAQTIEHNNAISSDDPDAIDKLETKLENKKKHREFMKGANKAIRKQDPKAFMLLEGATEQMWSALNTPHYGIKGFATYELSYISRDIKNLEKRIAELKSREQQGDKEHNYENGIRVLENVMANRLQIFFPHKPSEQFRNDVLKRNGFVWCRTEGAWQRKLNGNAKFAVRAVIESPVTY
ncbi:DUF3560 domain-containing protein [Chitinophaga sp. 22321]|uniref:DUF3560 domain-containing protein n=1 Tax=Chitinophaga sp. 22321 TaxID=3453909 RepID=UPI003F82BD9B